MKSIDEISKYYLTKLKPTLLKLELERKDVKRRVNTFAIPAILLITFIYFVFIKKMEFSLFADSIAMLLLNGAAYGFIHKYFTKEYKDSFKSLVVTPLIKFIDSKLVYKKDKFVNQKSFESAKFYNRKVSSYTGEDFVYGNLHEVNIKFSEISVFVKSNDEDTLAASGLFLVAEFPKHFKAHTIVYSNTFLPSSQGYSLGRNYEKMTMDSPSFNEKFTVYGTDQVEARYILSHALMEKVIEYNKEMPYPTTLSFIGGNIYILNNGGEILEPSVQRSLFDSDVVKSYALPLHFGVSVVETLKLNVKLWSKY